MVNLDERVSHYQVHWSFDHSGGRSWYWQNTAGRRISSRCSGQRRKCNRRAVLRGRNTACVWSHCSGLTCHSRSRRRRAQVGGHPTSLAERGRPVTTRTPHAAYWLTITFTTRKPGRSKPFL